MRRMVRAAGSLWILLALLVAQGPWALAAPPADDASRFLAHVATIEGGFTAPGIQAPAQHFIKLINPTALAAWGNFVYVADQGSGTLLRVDPISRRFEPLRRLPLAGSVKLRAGVDGSIYLVVPDRSEVVRLVAGSNVEQRYSDRGVVPRPIDIAIEPLEQRVWILDASGEIFEFTPLGQFMEQLGDGAHGPVLTSLVTGPRQVIGLDPGCRCAMELDSTGFPVSRFGPEVLKIPAAAAADRYGRLWVVDDGDRTLKVFEGDHLIASLAVADLGAIHVSALAFDHERAILADNQGGRLLVFHLLPPSAP